MTEDAARILRQALDLPRAQRVEIIEQLLRSLLSSTDSVADEVDAAWRQEIRDRLREFDSSNVTPVDWSQAREILTTD